jgi:hypothetical protein
MPQTFLICSIGRASTAMVACNDLDPTGIAFAGLPDTAAHGATAAKKTAHAMLRTDSSLAVGPALKDYGE